MKIHFLMSIKKWVAFFLLTVAFCLIAACGLKGAPTLKSYEKPAVPSGLKAIHRESEIIVSWTFPKVEERTIKGFHLMKSPGGEFERLAFVRNDERSYTDRDFHSGSVYQYKIAAESLKGIMSNDSNVLAITPKSTPPPPGKVSLSAVDGIELTWESAGEGILYNVYESDAPGAYSLMPLNQSPLKTTSYKGALNVKKPAYYTIRSLLGGDSRDEGPPSEEVKLDPSALVPSAPEGLRAVATGSGVYLTWKEPAETWITGYRIYRETSEKEGYIFIGKSEIPSFLDEESPLVKRNYRVTAVGSVKEGAPAEIRDVILVEQR